MTPDENNSRRHSIAGRSALLLLLLWLISNPVSSRAEDAANKPDSSDSRKSETRDSGSDELRQAVIEMMARINELQATIGLQQERISELERRLNVDRLSERNEGGSFAAAQAASPGSRAKQTPEPDLSTDSPNQAGPAPLAGWDRNRMMFRSADGQFESRLTGLGQLDFRGYQAGSHPPNTFALRRARLGIQGKVFEHFDFKIEADLADTRGTLLRDLWLGVNRIEELRLRFGHFRMPFSQEILMSGNTLDFVERSLVSNLSSDRSPGLMVFGELEGGILEYQIGAFNGKGLLAANNTGTPEGAVRFRLSPWKNEGGNPARGLSFGGAYTQGRSNGGLSVSGVMESRSSIFYSPTQVNGKIIRANGEVAWYAGPAALRAEYDQTNQHRANLGPDGGSLPGVVGKGYMAQFTYLLTGEVKPQNGLLTPKSSLFSEGAGHGLGAWEVKARYSNLQIADGSPRSNRAESIYFGVNWYLNPLVRHLLDFGIERFKDPLRAPRPGERGFFVVQSRVQVTF